jgi:ribonuclease BN (tRNA processing enzyme)
MFQIKTATRYITVLIGLWFGTSVMATCQSSGLQLQVLGSGGPGASAGRGSSAYVLWLNGRSRILLDAGGGSKTLFHQSGASLGDTDLIAISHFHPDHSSGLPAILWPSGAEFTLAGPDGNEVFPSVERFTQLLFEQGGVFAILGDRLEYETVEVSTDGSTITEVWADSELNVTGIGVPHANVPTVGYRVDYGDLSIAFTSDQNGSNTQFIEFIRDVDFLVIHMIGSENATGLMADLHAKPSVWGQMATEAGAGHVVVSHFSKSNAIALEENLAILGANYDGPITVSEDLMCVDVR